MSESAGAQKLQLVLWACVRKHFRQGSIENHRCSSLDTLFVKSNRMPLALFKQHGAMFVPVWATNLKPLGAFWPKLNQLGTWKVCFQLQKEQILHRAKPTVDPKMVLLRTGGNMGYIGSKNLDEIDSKYSYCCGKTQYKKIFQESCDAGLMSLSADAPHLLEDNCLWTPA